MMNLLDSDQILKLKSSINPIVFYEKYLKLKQVGSSMFANCPFHNEKTPSFSIKVDSGTFKCFGCGESGDIITFYKKINNVDFNTAVIEIAKEFNINIKINKVLEKEIKKNKNLYTFNKHILEHYRNNINKNSQASSYLLKERKISTEMIRLYKIGCTYNDNINVLFSKYSKYLSDLKLVVENEYGTIDYFRNNRIILPFIDSKGNVSGFTSRAINKNDKIKYLTSRTSEIFDKKRDLYGFNLAYSHIKEKKSAIIVEGQFDCIRGYQCGFKNIVAASGLSLHEEHINKLTRIVDTIYLCVDSDNKLYKDSAKKQLETIYAMIMKYSPFLTVKIIELPLLKGKSKIDLDEFLLENPSNEFFKLIKEAKTYNEYYILHILKNLNYKTIEEKKKYVYILKPHLNNIKGLLDRNQYIELVSNRLQYPILDVTKILQSDVKKEEYEKINQRILSIEKRAITAQKLILSLLLSKHEQELVSNIFDSKNIKSYLMPLYKNLFKYIENKLLQNLTTSDIIHNMFNDFNSELTRNIITDIIFKIDEILYYNKEELELFILEQIECIEGE